MINFNTKTNSHFAVKDVERSSPPFSDESPSTFQEMLKDLHSIITLCNINTTQWNCETLIDCVNNHVIRSSQNSIFKNPCG